MVSTITTDCAHVFWQMWHAPQYELTLAVTMSNFNPRTNQPAFSLRIELIAILLALHRRRTWYVYRYNCRALDLQPLCIYWMCRDHKQNKKQCSKIATEFGYSHLSSGDLLREEHNKGSDLAAKIDECIRYVRYVFEQTVECVIGTYLADDGYRSQFRSSTTRHDAGCP